MADAKPHVYEFGEFRLESSTRRLLPTENNRRARYYSLTHDGRRHFGDELAQWRRMSRAVNLVLEATI